MREGHFDPVGEAREAYIQVRMVFAEITEGLAAGGDHCRLKLSDGFVFDTGRVGQVARRASYGRRQPRIGIYSQANGFGLSVHGCSQVLRRRLPGSPGSNRDHPRRDALYAVPCIWCSIVRKCTALPSCRRWSRRWDLAWGASLKTVPDRRLRRQGGRTEPFAKELQVRFVSVVAPFGRFAIKLCLNAAF